MQFIARNGRISLGVRGDGNTESITYQISPLGKIKLTIADKYLFGKNLLEKEMKIIYFPKLKYAFPIFFITSEAINA